MPYARRETVQRIVGPPLRSSRNLGGYAMPCLGLVWLPPSRFLRLWADSIQRTIPTLMRERNSRLGARWERTTLALYGAVPGYRRLVDSAAWRLLGRVLSRGFDFSLEEIRRVLKRGASSSYSFCRRRTLSRDGSGGGWVGGRTWFSLQGLMSGDYFGGTGCVY